MRVWDMCALCIQVRMCVVLLCVLGRVGAGVGCVCAVYTGAYVCGIVVICVMSASNLLRVFGK